MTELQTWELLKQEAMTTNLDFAIFYYKDGKAHFIPCSSDSDIDLKVAQYGIKYGVPHLFVHFYKGQKNLTFNGIEVMAVDILENGKIKNVAFTSDYLKKKTPRPSKEELIKSVAELEGALKGKITNHTSASSKTGMLN